jgi:ClpP class serine protease
LETNGGGTDPTEGLITLIQNLTSDFRVVVANAAKSNGTLLGLAAKSIVMGASSELGPIEPLVQGIPCTILTQPQIAVWVARRSGGTLVRSKSVNGAS